MKKILTIAAFVFLALSLFSYTRSTNYIISHKPRVWGTVTDISQGYISIAVNEDDKLYPEYDELRVSLSVRNKDGSYSGSPGDEVLVYFSGEVTDGNPASLEKVYGIFTVTPAKWADKKD